ncbi:MAG: amidohydrolase [Sedimentibacter sp.]
MNFKEAAEKYNDFIIERRRFYHSIPELSYQEYQTTKEIAEDLSKMGIEIQTFPDYTGVIGTINGGKPGKTVMLRADIDALNIEEKTNLPFASTNGKMHACGHDAHISMLMGAARMLVDVKDELKGTVKLMFQGAEESSHGAEYYVKNGVLDGVDSIFGMHIWGTLDAPYMNLEAGSRMASVDNFRLTVKGLASHGSAPNLGKDAIVASAAIIMNIQTIVSRNNNPLNPLVVSIGTINGGQAFNIIANNVVMDGTVRCHSREVRATIEQQLRDIVDNTAKTFGCEAVLDYNYYAAPIINDHEDINKIVINAATKLYGEECLAPMPKLMGAEDFAYFMEKVPAFYGFIGAKNEEKGIIYSNHNDKFTVDEESLHRGAALYAQYAYDFLEEKSK